jgi:hypothetical protein
MKTMFNKEEAFEGDVLFIAGQIRTFQNLLTDDFFMQSLPGKAMKGLIKGNALFKRIDTDLRYKRKVLLRLKDYFSEDVLNKAIRNIY